MNIALVAKVIRKTLSRARKLRKSLTRAEALLWSRLRNDIHGVRFRRQHPIGPYIADFACVTVRLVVEVDGATHSTDLERRRDEIRDGYLRSLGWKVMRVWNGDVYAGLDEVVDQICQAVSRRIRAISD